REVVFGPGGDVEEGFVAEAGADELNAERQAFGAGAGWQGHARAPRQSPDRVEARIAGRAEPFWRLAGGGRGHQHIDVPEEIVEMTAESFGRVERFDVGIEREFAAGGQYGVAQHLADQVVVLVVFVRIVARRLVIEDAAVVLEDIHEFRRERDLADRSAGGRKTARALFDQRLHRGLGGVPGRRAAESDPRRGDAAINR